MSEKNDMTADERYCYDCIHNEVCRHCPHDGCDFKETLKEAEPVEHGRWMYPFYCSACGFEPYYSSDLTYNYCPNCGARMDGDSE